MFPSQSEILTELSTLDDKCRTCLSSSQSTLISIFEKQSIHGQAICFAEMITCCTALEIQYDDVLPKFICQLCSVDIIGAFTFRQKALNSDFLLRYVASEMSGVKSGTNCSENPKTKVKIKIKKKRPHEDDDNEPIMNPSGCKVAVNQISSNMIPMTLNNSDQIIRQSNVIVDTVKECNIVHNIGNNLIKALDENPLHHVPQSTNNESVQYKHSPNKVAAKLLKSLIETELSEFVCEKNNDKLNEQKENNIEQIITNTKPSLLVDVNPSNPIAQSCPPVTSPGEMHNITDTIYEDDEGYFLLEVDYNADDDDIIVLDDDEEENANNTIIQLDSSDTYDDKN